MEKKQYWPSLSLGRILVFCAVIMASWFFFKVNSVYAVRCTADSDCGVDTQCTSYVCLPNLIKGGPGTCVTNNAPDGDACTGGVCQSGSCSSYTDTWYVGSWGPCSSNTCGVSGTQTRTVECGQNGTGTCDPSTEPVSTQTCTGPCGTTYYSCQGNLGCQEDDSCTSATGNCSTSSNCNSSCATAACTPNVTFGAYTCGLNAVNVYTCGYHNPPFQTSGTFSNGNTGSISVWVEADQVAPWGSKLTGTCPAGAACGFGPDRTNQPYTIPWIVDPSTGFATANIDYNIVPGPSTPTGNYTVGFGIINSDSNNCGVGYSQVVSINGLPSYSASCTMTAPSTVTAGVPFTATVTMTNTGSNTWTPGANYNLGSYDSSSFPWTTNWNPGRWFMPAGTSVAPGQSYTFSNISVTPPSTPGVYPNFGFLMVQDGVTWFPSSSACIQSMTVTAGAAPTVNLNATVWDSATRSTVWTGYHNNTGTTFQNDAGPNIVVYAGAPFQLNWSATNATGACTLTGEASPGTSGSDNTLAAGGGSWSQTYTLNCSNGTGTTTKQLTISVPPDPTNISASPAGCGVNGTGFNFSWTRAAGYAYSYVRVQDNLGNTFFDDDYNGAIPTSYITVPGRTYTYWVHTDDFSSPGGPWSGAPTGTITCNNPGPSVTLSANPNPVNSGQPTTLTWVLNNATSCTDNNANMPAGSWTTGQTDTVGVSTGALTTATTYSITCTGPGGTASNSVTVAINPGPVDGGPGGTTFNISNNTCGQVNLTWTAGSGANAYNIYRNTTGSNPVAGDKIKSAISGLSFVDSPLAGTGFVVGQKYYYWVESVNTTTGLTGPQVPASSNASSGITATSCVPTAPTGGATCNSQMNTAQCPSVGGIPACGFVKVVWTDNSGGTAASFNIYQDGTKVGNVLQSALISGHGYFLVPIVDGNNHNYAITAVSSTGLESSPASAASNNPFAGYLCGPNLYGSDKEIIAINGNGITGVSSQMCNAQGDPLPSYVSVKAGDTLTFSIDVCNNGTATASSISISDHLVNLQKAGSSWNMCYNTAPATRASCQTINDSAISVSGVVPNQTLSFNLGSRTIPAGSAGYVVFNAQIPPSNGNASHLFQNTAHITYGASSVDVFTPLQQFLNGNGVPVIIERP